MIKYKVILHRSRGKEIERREVIRETPYCVFVHDGRRERKENKSGAYEQRFDTWNEAYVFLLARAQRDYDRAARDFSQCKLELESVKAMINPETPHD